MIENETLALNFALFPKKEPALPLMPLSKVPQVAAVLSQNIIFVKMNVHGCVKTSCRISLHQEKRSKPAKR